MKILFIILILAIISCNSTKKLLIEYPDYYLWYVPFQGGLKVDTLYRQGNNLTYETRKVKDRTIIYPDNRKRLKYYGYFKNK